MAVCLLSSRWRARIAAQVPQLLAPVETHLVPLRTLLGLPLVFVLSSLSFNSYFILSLVALALHLPCHSLLLQRPVLDPTSGSLSPCSWGRLDPEHVLRNLAVHARWLLKLTRCLP